MPRQLTPQEQAEADQHHGIPRFNDDGTPSYWAAKEGTRSYADTRAASEAHQKEIDQAVASLPGYAQEAGKLSGEKAKAADRNTEQRARLQDEFASSGFHYGQSPTAAASDIARYRDASAGFLRRGQIQGDYSQADQSRASQQDALGMYHDAALGRGPSAAHGQFQQGLDRSMAANESLANSARGGSLGMAQARLQAMNQNSGMLAGSTAQAAQLRAQEQQAGMAGYAGLSGNIRGQDAEAARSNAELGLRGRAENDQTALAYEQLGQGVQGSEMNGMLSREAAIAGNNQMQNQILQQQLAQNDANNARNWQTAQGVASTVVPIVKAIPTDSGASDTGGGTTWDRGSDDQTGSGGTLWNAGEGSVSGSVKSNTRALPAAAGLQRGTGSYAPMAPRPVAQPGLQSSVAYVAQQPAQSAGLPARPQTPASQRLGTAAKRYW